MAVKRKRDAAGGGAGKGDGRGAARAPAFDRRSSGLLMHVTSLPGRHGSGDLSAEALAFVDFCAEAGQAWWQMLPAGPPGAPPGNSPYSSNSSAAGSPYLVSLEGLAREGLLSARDLAPPPGISASRVQFRRTNVFRERRLRIAYERFRASGGKAKRLRDESAAFAAAQRDWLDDFALFSALKRHFRDAPWTGWDAGLRSREAAALSRAAADLSDEVDYHRFVQFMFDRQWRALRDHARRRGVGLVGDIPIFVIHDSVDVWRDPRLFRLGKGGRPTHVSGVPPDAFSDEGQRWGHPQYDWDAHVKDGFRWWVARFRRTFDLFDAVRIDHFLGFSRVWSIPAASPTAKGGRWMKSPGHELFSVLRRELGERAIIAEDLGVLTPEAAALRDAFNFPGMRVVQFGFGGGGGDPYHRPHSYPPRCVAYTGTHDSDTVAGWFKKLGRADRENALDYTGGDARTIHQATTRALMASAADTVIVPLQDVLGLGNRARMNMPGVAEGNWSWRLEPRALTRSHARELRRLAQLTGRVPDSL